MIPTNYMTPVDDDKAHREMRLKYFSPTHKVRRVRNNYCVECNQPIGWQKKTAERHKLVCPGRKPK